MENFSNDKRKYAHVNGMLALNQNKRDKENQVMRLGWLVLREATFSMTRQLAVGTCFALSRAITCASFNHGYHKEEERE
jgi:hypothetical protein